MNNSSGMLLAASLSGCVDGFCCWCVCVPHECKDKLFIQGESIRRYQQTTAWSTLMSSTLRALNSDIGTNSDDFTISVIPQRWK